MFLSLFLLLLKVMSEISFLLSSPARRQEKEPFLVEFSPPPIPVTTFTTGPLTAVKRGVMATVTPAFRKLKGAQLIEESLNISVLFVKWSLV